MRLLLPLMVVLAGCSITPKGSRGGAAVVDDDVVLPDNGQELHASELGQPHRARQRGVLSRFRQQEQMPQGMMRSELEEEVTLTRFDSESVCFDVVARTESDLDRPLSEWTWFLNDEEVLPRH